MDESRRWFRHKTDHHTSVLLNRVLDELPTGEVTVGYLVAKLRGRSFGGILMLLTILGLLPIVSFFAGLVIVYVGVQMALGFRAPQLPGVLAGRQVRSAAIQRYGKQAVSWVSAGEAFVRPRWLMLTRPPSMRIIGLIVTCLAVVLVLPVPLINIPPAIALFMFALAILERDGLMLLFAVIAAVMAMAAGAFLMTMAVKALLLFIHTHAA